MNLRDYSYYLIWIKAEVLIPFSNVFKMRATMHCRCNFFPITGICVALFGCGDLRNAPETVVPPEVTYLDDIKPLLQEKCVSCHSGATSAGSYDMSSWRGLLGPGSDRVVRNVIAGDATSLTLTAFADTQNAPHHQNLLSAGQHEKIRRWIVVEKLAYFRSLFHPPQWLNPTDRNATNFHGGALRAQAWDLTSCKNCHGSDLSGGSAKVACSTCHSKGVDDCSTCHGRAGASSAKLADLAPPSDLSGALDPTTSSGVGVHAAHLSTTLFGTIDCSECHLKPAAVSDAGHLFDDATAKKTDLKAEVTFGARAKAGGVQAVYDKTTGTCTVACHGAGLKKIGAKPQWKKPGSVACGSCHAVPYDLGGPDCSSCHPQAVAKCQLGSAGCLPTAEGVGIRFIDPLAHGDGKVVVGKAGAEGSCYGCHGTAESQGAPPTDLQGNSDVTSLGVGMHKLHVSAGLYRNGLPCATCHLVPQQILDSGHIDTTPPAEVSFGDLATGQARNSSLDLKPTWDRGLATCSNVYCHALDSGEVSTWRWNRPVPGGVNCGSCHGFPPKTTLFGAVHPNDNRCANCHSQAFVAGKMNLAKHINGTVELGP